MQTIDDFIDLILDVATKSSDSLKETTDQFKIVVEARDSFWKDQIEELKNELRTERSVALYAEKRTKDLESKIQDFMNDCGNSFLDSSDITEKHYHIFEQLLSENGG